MLKAIQDIRKMQAAERLVVFVGSGVSANSGIRSWVNLVERMAEKIGYEFDSKQYSSEELLRVPEYYYNQSESNNHEEYYNEISEVFLGDYLPNELDELILNICPQHIITTNYDKLLEKSNSVNLGLYSVVAKDEDLLAGSGNHYIVKMHGDIENVESVVLKETDYLEYEQKHVMISTFIKSLLIV